MFKNSKKIIELEKKVERLRESLQKLCSHKKKELRINEPGEEFYYDRVVCEICGEILEENPILNSGIGIRNRKTEVEKWIEKYDLQEDFLDDFLYKRW